MYLNILWKKTLNTARFMIGKCGMETSLELQHQYIKKQQRDLINYVYKDEPELTFESNLEERLARQGRNKLLNVISFKEQNKLNLQKEGWNPSKTAAILKAPFEKLNELTRKELNEGGVTTESVPAFTPEEYAGVEKEFKQTDSDLNRIKKAFGEKNMTSTWHDIFTQMTNTCFLDKR